MWYFVRVLPLICCVTSGMWYFMLVLPLVCGTSYLCYLWCVVLHACVTSGMWYFMLVLPLVCGTSYLCYLWYVADTRVDRHIAALLHEEKLPKIIQFQ